MSLTRRAALQLIAGSAMVILLPRFALAATTPAPLRFRVVRGAKSIGTHSVSFQRMGTTLEVSTAIELDVKVAFISAFRFSHKSEERWESERLVGLNGRTDENGEIFDVQGMPSDQGFEVIAPNGTTFAKTAAFTTNNLWNPAMLRSKDLVDAHHGGVVGVVSRNEAEEEITLAGAQVLARRYRLISPFLAGTIWYDKEDRWRKSVFEIRGEKVEYVPA